MSRRRILLVRDPEREGVAGITARVRAIIEAQGAYAGTLDAEERPLEELPEFDVAVVIGGDGTLIRQARRLVVRDPDIVGVNVGRLGFLVEFDADSLERHAAVALGESPSIRRCAMIEATVHRRGATILREPAVNDFAVAAGEPFRMIELAISLDGRPGPTMAGDGLIVATPLGSTAYNAAAGGPIVHPEVDAMVITPLAPHSLAFRPIVVAGDAEVAVEVSRANAGTALVRDGMAIARLEAGDRVVMRPHGRAARIVANPDVDYWRVVREKLRWAEPPSYRTP